MQVICYSGQLLVAIKPNNQGNGASKQKIKWTKVDISSCLFRKRHFEIHFK